MVAPKRSFLNREKILINVLKALASGISMCSRHVILLLKITSKYVTLLRLGQMVTLPTHTWEVFDSNIGRDTDYNDRNFCRFLALFFQFIVPCYPIIKHYKI
jgi:hypothetical protein